MTKSDPKPEPPQSSAPQRPDVDAVFGTLTASGDLTPKERP